MNLSLSASALLLVFVANEKVDLCLAQNGAAVFVSGDASQKDGDGRLEE